MLIKRRKIFARSARYLSLPLYSSFQEVRISDWKFVLATLMYRLNCMKLDLGPMSLFRTNHILVKVRSHMVHLSDRISDQVSGSAAIMIRSAWNLVQLIRMSSWRADKIVVSNRISYSHPRVRYVHRPTAFLGAEFLYKPLSFDRLDSRSVEVQLAFFGRSRCCRITHTILSDSRLVG